MITKTERQELRGVVRQQFKVLRHEVERRQSELIAEMEGRLVERYSDVDEARQALMWKAHEVCEAASREITDLFRESGVRHGGEFEARMGRGVNDVPEDVSPEVTIERPIKVGMEHIHWAKTDRVQLRRALVAGIESHIAAAKMSLERQEADLLRTLAVGAIESEEARAFLAGIPTVGELVPAARLAELEAQFTEDET